jgi:UDP-glucuronate decarboxylase|tara:strand:- start:2682 stop:3701 length:1020 start_codon:yes stop_codon:yes gene_type:complete
MLDTIVKQDCKKILENIKINKFKKKKILILGGNSFLACYIQAILSHIDCQIISVSLNNPKGILKNVNKKKINFIKADLTNEEKIKKIINKKFDFIFHFATYGQPKKWKNNELSTINLNINLLNHVLNHSVKYKSKILYLSSAEIYKLSNKDKLINEKDPLSIDQFKDKLVYVNSKITGEQLCRIYKEKYKIPVYIVRPAHTYGPGQDYKDPRIIPQLIKRATSEKFIYLHDKGKSIRTWGYIADISAMMLNIIQYGKSMTYNISGSEHKSILDIVKIISQIFNNKKIQFKYKKLSYTNTKYTTLKISSKKYNLEFKNKFKTNFIDGMTKTIKWNKLWQK